MRPINPGRPEDEHSRSERRRIQATRASAQDQAKWRQWMQNAARADAAQKAVSTQNTVRAATPSPFEQMRLTAQSRRAAVGPTSPETEQGKSTPRWEGLRGTRPAAQGMPAWGTPEGTRPDMPPMPRAEITSLAGAGNRAEDQSKGTDTDAGSDDQDWSHTTAPESRVKQALSNLGRAPDKGVDLAAEWMQAATADRLAHEQLSHELLKASAPDDVHSQADSSPGMADAVSGFSAAEHVRRELDAPPQRLGDFASGGASDRTAQCAPGEPAQHAADEATGEPGTLAGRAQLGRQTDAEQDLQAEQWRIGQAERRRLDHQQDVDREQLSAELNEVLRDGTLPGAIHIQAHMLLARLEQAQAGKSDRSARAAAVAPRSAQPVDGEASEDRAMSPGPDIATARIYERMAQLNAFVTALEQRIQSDNAAQSLPLLTLRSI